ncbi:MAG: hypothetical protein WBC13_12860 [Dokdonella sp.]|jgi:hypothetical protein|uniref:hypothetical protein n=1 Tax=Dokdonella sp. TaxID=2291710 RepID=UPI001B6A9952|nr:hypothetical protein [Dokdonella sp.]MBK8124088.1 hypothetical protein [Dokdonella sp.]MBP6326777.1 hypothetical protein [Dokdonella sp.]MBP6330365.1 hypothetical protein [Dokdonella sp.]HNV09565.1 hypothetical protein [Dokdonella sp.]HPW04208.1 hypothetical protein [Dokdonella sp.]
MKMSRSALAVAVVMLMACTGGGPSGESVAATATAAKGPLAHVVTRQFSVEMDKLLVDEHVYVDGVAMRVEDGAGALLTETPLSACAKLAVVGRGNLEFDAATLGEKPALRLVQNSEYPQGAALVVEAYSTTTLEGTLPGLDTKGKEFVASGDVGDAGWGSIDPTKYGAEKSPHVRMDVKLPFSSLESVDSVAADASPEAKWLRDLRKQATSDGQGVADASLQVPADDYNAYSTTSAWSNILTSWSSPSVTAVASDKDCATLVLREPGFSGGYSEALVQTRMVGNVRKVVAASTKEFNSVEGDYVVGRFENAALGGVPILHARAAREDGVGLVVYFSDKPIANEPFETLVGKQRMLRAVAGIEYGNQYSFSTYDMGGPGAPVEQVSAGNSTTNPYADEKTISGLIKLQEGEAVRISVNYQLALGGAGK